MGTDSNDEPGGLTADGAPVADGSDGIERFHGELYRIARRELGRMARSGTIDTVALVNEAWLKAEGRDQGWDSRAHFLASMTTIMRHILVDHFRERAALQRGGDWLRVTSSQLDALCNRDSPVDVIAIDQSMSELGRMSDRLERVIELKIFGGLTTAEISEVLEISTATVTRELRFATAFLRQSLAQGA